MTWKAREPADAFFRRMQGFHAKRADAHPDPEERQVSANEIERLNTLIGAFGRIMPR